MRSKRVLIAGGGGFIGGHLAGALLSRGHAVLAADIKPLEAWYQRHAGAESVSVDLGDKAECLRVVEGCDEVYDLACDMGGIGFIEGNRAACMHNVLIDTHLLMAARQRRVGTFFYASSACVYPTHRQADARVTALEESEAYPALPEDGYGWEKLFAERLCQHYAQDYGLEVRVARLHNVYGPWGTWDGGREKAPAAICRKVAEAQLAGTNEIEIWGDGEQTRSFMYVDDCVLGIDKLMASSHREPINLGRGELVTINQLVDVVEHIAGTRLTRTYRLGAPQGVRGRNSDNTRIKQVLGWEPQIDLLTGLSATFAWVKEQVRRRARGERVVS